MQLLVVIGTSGLRSVNERMGLSVHAPRDVRNGCGADINPQPL